MNLDKIYEIKLKEIDISTANVRHSDPEIELDELVDSIKKHGLLQPVVLLGEHGEPRYSLISGQR
jgi:ParB-like chromosome segregation protein Spo0J